jgi:peptidoglycan/LPS O-acetylase OafA/YrhL
MPKLPNLDTLRFIAAGTVLAYHVDLALLMNGKSTKHHTFFPFGFGANAVVFFFVLSGFLITYLLLKEKAKRDISIKSFYLKRVLRIWPLYYLIVIASFVLLNTLPLLSWHGVTDVITIDKQILWNAFLLLLICPNIVMLNSQSIGYANPTWSIGVEEQFYLIWPWLVRSKHFLKYTLFIVLGLFLLSRGLLGRVASVFPAGGTLKKLLNVANDLFTFGYSFRIDAMAIGALGAYAVVNKSSILPIVFSRSFQIGMYAILLPLMILPDLVPYQFYSLVFMLMIMNMACNPANLFNIGNRWMDYLGQISYGIYLFHYITIMPAIWLVVNYWGIPVNFGSELLILGVSFLATIALSSLSYYTYERIFMKMKERMDKKIKTDNASNAKSTVFEKINV